MSGTLTTRVLDGEHHVPAAGIRVELWQIAGEMSIPVATATTDADGRTSEPLVAAGKLRTGNYELRYSVREHFHGTGLWDIIPIRFDIRDANADYALEFTVSPMTYTIARTT